MAVGTAIANRQETQLEKMIGFFVNTLVMRIGVREGMSFRELVREVRETALKAYEHQDVPFERLVGELELERSLNRTSVFQVMFSMQNASSSVPRLKGVEVELVEGGERQGRFCLAGRVWDRGEKIEMLWQ